MHFKSNLPDIKKNENAITDIDHGWDKDQKKHTVQSTVVGVSLNSTLANPKSHILSLQFAFANIFFGLRSRWYTFAETNTYKSDMENRETS